MQLLAILVLSIAAAILYGIAHDQITARVCIEYFTIGHPRIVPTASPTVLGLVWGIVATWWAGLLLGLPLAIAARAGRRPKRDARTLVGPILVLLVVMGACALVAGILGFLLGQSGAVVLLESLASRVPASRHARFLAALWAHSASYAVGFIGGIVLAVRVWRSRGLPPPDAT